MKKTFVAVAVLGAFAGSAMAADVTLYGRIDTAVAFQKGEKVGGEKVDTLTLNSGWSSGSRWGIKGTEDLGNGLKVGFTLESGFSHDSGKSGQDGRLFGREAAVTVEGDFGKVYLGRIGSIASDAGSLSLLGNTSVFGDVYGYAAMYYSTGLNYNRYDNVIGYVAPKFAGVEVRAMYSGDADTVKKESDYYSTAGENKGGSTRYAALGVTYAAGPLNAYFVADYTMWGNKTVNAADRDDGYNVIVGGNYKMDIATVYARANYFDNMVPSKSFAGLTTEATKNGLQGYGLEFGAKVPVCGGDVMAAIGYRDAENVKDSADSYKLFNANIGYNYAFSKRTNVYGIVGYIQEEQEATKKDNKAHGYQVGVGLLHKF